VSEADGCHVTLEVLDDIGFRRELPAKIVEEAQEARTAPAPELLAELADVLEVLQARLAVTGISWEQLEAARALAEAIPL
jgi:predicted house-cleaning noncanonical NTP pyrophosphatase (MazG superfamily)